MADILYTEFKDQQVKNFLKNIDKKLKNVKDGEKKYAGLLSSIIFQDVSSHFESQKGSAGPWKSWRPKYKIRMDEVGKGGNKILQDTGKLRQNFKPTNYKKDKDGLMWFNDAKTKGGAPYAAIHDKGLGPMPKRDFMWLSKEAMDKVSEQTLQFLIDEGV